jgi:hypothetical protein
MLFVKAIFEFESLRICQLPVDNGSSFLLVQQCHMIPRHSMYLHLLLTDLETHNTTEHVFLVHYMAMSLCNSRALCYLYPYL